MTQIAISEEIDTSLASAAASRGCSKDELAALLIADGLSREEEYELSPEQESRLLQSIEQAERGETVDGETVMARFRQTLDRIAAR